jgi:flagellar basal-body rod protein FlgF
MDALIYTAMSGAERALRGQQVHANNLANMDTAGFRANMELATAAKLPGYGYDDRHMTQLQANAVNTRQGTLKSTGRELDVAISCWALPAKAIPAPAPSPSMRMAP